jgi:hypothetical protein
MRIDLRENHKLFIGCIFLTFLRLKLQKLNKKSIFIPYWKLLNIARIQPNVTKMYTR